MVEKKKNLSDFSIKRVHRLIGEERKYSLVRYFKKFLRDSSAEEYKVEIEEYASKLIADENYPVKKDVLKKLEGWNS
jgi:hypothetical protein